MQSLRGQADVRRRAGRFFLLREDCSAPEGHQLAERLPDKPRDLRGQFLVADFLAKELEGEFDK